MAFTLAPGGTRLHWRLEGAANKPAMVLLSSIGTDASLYDRTAPLLLSDFRLLRLDTRGHGASDAPSGEYDLALLAADVTAVMDDAGIDKAAVCGVSLGGMIAMELALTSPERVSALILACTSAAMDAAAWQARMETVRRQGLAAILDVAITRFLSEPFRRLHPEHVETVRSGLLSSSGEGYAACCAAIRDMNLLSRLGSITAPTLLIAGAMDIATPFADHGDRIASAISGAKTVLLETAHLPPLEDPSAFAGAIRSFLHADVAEQGAKETLFEAGLKVRRRVLGDAWVDRALENRTAFNTDYQAMITRYAWNEIWARPGLDHRVRRLLVLAICASLARWEEFRLHVRAGIDEGGLTQLELKETLMQLAIYAGVPAANTAFAEAANVMEEMGLK